MPRLPAGKQMVHDAGAPGVRQELRPEPDEPARGDAELEPHAPAAVVHHFRHHPAACACLRDHHTLKLLGHVDHQVLDGLAAHAVDLLGHDVGPRHLQLVAFTPHHLDENRELKLAPADHLQLLGRVGVLHAQRDVAEQLACQPVSQVPRCDELPLPARHRRRIDAKNHRHGRLVDGGGWNRDAVLGVGDGLADRDVRDPRQADDVAGGGVLDFDALEPVEGEELRDLRLLDAIVELEHRDGVAKLHRAVEDAPDGNASQVLARVEVGNEHLQRRLGVSTRRRHMVHDRLEERPKIVAGRPHFSRREAITRVGVEHWKLDLFLSRVEVDEQVIDFVQHLFRPRVRSIDLVENDDGRQAALQSLAKHEPRLRQRSFGRVDQQHHPIDHRERPLHFPAEISVARGVDDIDEEIPEPDRCVLRQNRDTSLAFQIGVVHDSVGHMLVRAEGAALPEERVHECGLAVVDVRNNGNVAPKRVGDLYRVPVRGHPFSITRRAFGYDRVTRRLSNGEELKTMPLFDTPARNVIVSSKPSSGPMKPPNARRVTARTSNGVCPSSPRTHRAHRHPPGCQRSARAATAAIRAGRAPVRSTERERVYGFTGSRVREPANRRTCEP